MKSYELYYLQNVRSAKSDLCNPRISFNSGYWDAKSDLKNEREIRDVSDHFNPYYAAGYEAGQGRLASNQSSEIDFAMFCKGLSGSDYETTAKAILESLIRGREYLFSKKRDRSQFTDHDWNDMISRYDRELPAQNPEQFCIKHSVLNQFGLLNYTFEGR